MKALTLFAFLSLLMACHDGKQRIPEQSAIKRVVAPVYFHADTIGISLADYFSEPGKIKKISASDGLVVLRKGFHGLQVLVKDTIKPLFNLRVKYEDYNYDIPVIREGRTPSGDSLRLTTDVLKADTIYLTCSSPMSFCTAYIDNYKLDDRQLVSASTRIGIVLPEDAAVLENAELRIWASDGKYVSNGMVLPLKNGRLATHSGDLDSSDIRVASWRLKIGCYDEVNDPAGNELVRLLSYPVGYGDSLCLSAPRPTGDNSPLTERKNTDCFKHHMAAMFGDHIALRSDKQVSAYLRTYFGKEIIVVKNKAKEAMTFKLDLPRKYRETGFKSLSGNRFSYDNARLITDVSANSVEVIYN